MTVATYNVCFTLVSRCRNRHLLTSHRRGLELPHRGHTWLPTHLASTSAFASLSPSASVPEVVKFIGEAWRLRGKHLTSVIGTHWCLICFWGAGSLTLQPAHHPETSAGYTRPRRRPEQESVKARDKTAAGDGAGGDKDQRTVFVAVLWGWLDGHPQVYILPS